MTLKALNQLMINAYFREDLMVKNREEGKGGGGGGGVEAP